MTVDTKMLDCYKIQTLSYSNCGNKDNNHKINT